MEDDWEAEDFVPQPPSLVKAPPRNIWDDEEVSEEDVKESWEDDDQPKEIALTPAPTVDTGKKQEKKIVGRKEKVGAKAGEKAPEITAVPEDDARKILVDKLHKQRLVEESDYQNTSKLFGNTSGDKTLENFIPKSESDFIEYAELVGQKLRAFEKSFHYVTLVKAVIRHSVASLKSVDAKEIGSSIQVIANDKLKIEKAAAAGKKKTGGSKKKQLHMDTDEDVVGLYDNVNDYDFM